jgi:L-erythrulose 1-phosphate isomerase
MTPVHKLLIGSNLKMYKTIAETVEYLTRLQELTSDLSSEDLILWIMSSYTTLPAAAKFNTGILKLGPQNMSWEDRGQFTGEVSPLMIKELGLNTVMIGHSERRHVFGETDQEENKKVVAALNHGFSAMLCIGETAEDKDQGISVEQLRIQLKVGLRNVKEDQLDRLWLLYEPVWAVGANSVPATPEYASAIQGQIRKTLVEMFPQKGGFVGIQYGGSVNLQNCTELIVQPNIDGLGIGRAAWNADDFNTIIRKVLPLWKNKN